MTALDPGRFSHFTTTRRIHSWTPWPASTTLVVLMILGLCAGRFDSLHDLLILIPRDVIAGRIWQLISGQFVQPTQLAITIVALLTAAIFAREVEERKGGRSLWSLIGITGVLSCASWVAIQTVAKRVGLQSGWELPLVSYPAVTALVAYRAVPSPLVRLRLTARVLPTWLVASGYGVATGVFLSNLPWSIYAPAHVIAFLIGAVLGLTNQRSWRSLIRELTIDPRGVNSPPPATISDMRSKLNELSDDEIDRRLDAILARIAARGEDSLSSSDRAVLREASHRLRNRRGS